MITVDNYNHETDEMTTERATPKQKAQLILMDHVSTCLGYWQERCEDDVAAMTPSELRAVEDQLQKLANRVAKMCGFTEAWSS